MFDFRPAPSEIMIVGWQGPDAVKMIGELNPGVDRERATRAHGDDGIAKGKQDRVVAQDGAATVGDQREEVSGAGEGSSISGHREIVVHRSCADESSARRRDVGQG